MKRILSLFVLWGVLGMAAPAAAAPPQLIKAYKKEFAFLQAQKRALKARLEALINKSNARVARAESQLKQMQLRTMFMREKAEQIQRDLQEAGKTQAQNDEYKDQLDKVLERARFALKKADMKLPKADKNNSYSKLLKEAFVKGAQLMKDSRKIRRTKGSFFLADGTRTKGDVVYIGGIAAYGISPNGKGALAPAGNGRLKLWPKPASSTATALLSGSKPATLDIFLFENLQKEITFKAEKTYYEFLQSGGVIGWIIVWLGVLAGFLVIVRLFIIARATAGSEKLIADVEALVKSGHQQDAIALCQKNNTTTSRVLLQAVQHHEKDRSKQEEFVAEVMLQEAPRLERFGTLIAITAAVAPLLGLLGTVTGMISTFDVITEYGTGDPKLLAGGISEALVTTKLGLVVAIPALLLGSMVSGRAEAVLTRVEWGALHIMNLMNLRPKGPSAMSSASVTQGPVEQDPIDETVDTRGADLVSGAMPMDPAFDNKG